MISNAGFNRPASLARPWATPGFNTIASPWARSFDRETFSPRNESSYKNGSLTDDPGSFCRRGNGCLANAITILLIVFW